MNKKLKVIIHVFTIPYYSPTASVTCWWETKQRHFDGTSFATKVPQSPVSTRPMQAVLRVL
jgi:hypothetical protein